MSLPEISWPMTETMTICKNPRHFFRHPSIYPSGFTLIDTMIAVLIIGIIGMTALPKISDFLTDRRLSAACSLVMAGLEYASALSIRYQRPFSMSTDTTIKQFQVKDTAPYPDSSAVVRTGNAPPVNAEDVVFNPVADQWYATRLDQMPGLEEIQISSIPADITFYPDGHSGEFDSLLIVALGSMSKTIRVDSISSRVSID